MRHLPDKEVLLCGAAGAACSVLIGWTFYKSLLLSLLLLPIGAFGYPYLCRERLRDNARWKLNLAFKESMEILSSFVSAGYSLENAIAETAQSLCSRFGREAAISREYCLMVKGIRMNQPVELLFADFAARSHLEDAENFAEVLAVAKRRGGNLRSIIDRAASVIRDKAQVTEEIRTMTASRRFEQRIMNLMPFGIILYIRLTTNGFLDVMYETLAGRGIMTVCLLILLASVMLSQHILRIRV